LKVYQSLTEFNAINCAVATTGTFDGVHLGHKKILNQLVQTAHKVGGESVLLTFSPHPRLVLQPDAELKLLTSLEEKIGLLEQTGLHHLIIHPFTKEFSRTPSLEFVREILVNQIGVKQLVIGYDHHFGRNREGSFDHLKEFGPIYGFEVEEIPALDIDAVNISSTKIRTALTEGNVELHHLFRPSLYHRRKSNQRRSNRPLDWLSHSQPRHQLPTQAHSRRRGVCRLCTLERRAPQGHGQHRPTPNRGNQ